MPPERANSRDNLADDGTAAELEFAFSLAACISAVASYRCPLRVVLEYSSARIHIVDVSARVSKGQNRD